ncbi:hypothetical protein BHQ18_11020 [Mycolicibacterium flavescens]|uniref:3-methyl-2-oxobutanoate hydroxymethyltransferase n=1 Tax=Mycolicibacterium flavescens TaxID=1776 RepID=A0A1E3RJF7_MYCFV|nr:hypothetical protein BHQ18_11020 [Mycolicibacterium flavescens]
MADMPFGSYEGGPAQALATATRFLKETGAHAVKLEGGERVAERRATTRSPGRHRPATTTRHRRPPARSRSRRRDRSPRCPSG